MALRERRLIFNHFSSLTQLSHKQYIVQILNKNRKNILIYL